jgi:CubicO group peptidase (beta-lactamase class C family)
MKTHLLRLTTLLAFTACGATPEVAPPAPAAPAPPVPMSVAPASTPASAPATVETRTQAEDGPLETASGATWPVAAGWSITRTTSADAASPLYVLRDPEKGVALVIDEATGVAPAEAIARAWQRFSPGFALPAKQTITPPPAQWDEVVQTTYETPSGSNRLAIGLARRKGDRVWVNLIDADAAVMERRGAQLQNTVERVKAPGVEDETWADRKPNPLTGDRKAAFVAFVESTRAALRVPGAAVAVVQDGQVVLEQGFGVREVGRAPGKADSVTAETPFFIGSTTKSLSTLLMARAVEAGLFTWDTPVKQVLPGFTLGDAALADRMTMRNLVCGCTGIPRADMELLFSFKDVTPEGLMASMSTLTPTTAFGETFQYNNQLVAAAGFAAGHAFFPKLSLGAAYDKALRAQVLVPLGMTRSTPDYAEAVKLGVVSSHGDDIHGQSAALRATMERFTVPLRPSGGVASTAHDMAKYLQAELARGKSVTGAQVASEANVLLRRTPQIKIGEDRGYGMGLAVGKTKGLSFVEHGGATFGQFTTFFFLPDAGLGLVVLTNGPGPLGSLVRRRLMELVFDGRPEAEAALVFTLAEQKKAVARNEAELGPPEPEAAQRALLGTYRDARLGDVRVVFERGELLLDVGEWRSRLGWQKRTDGGKPDLVLLDPPVAGLPFERLEADGKTSLRLTIGQHQYTFAPVPTHRGK